MTDGDHYCTYANVRDLLMNQGLGTSGNTMYNDAALEAALDISMADIHAELGGITTKITLEPYLTQLKGIQRDLILQQILLARHTQNNNLASGSETLQFWQVPPTLTRDHLRKLRRIRMVINTNPVAMVYNTNTGKRLL